MILIESEKQAHREAIRNVTEIAFAASELGHQGEAGLIDAIRAASDQTLSLVAMHDDEVVGHILFSPVAIRRNDQTIYGMGLAPMSVLPAFQNIGIGSQLVSEGLRRLAALNTPFTVVAGHAEFYRRFGFVLAADFGITHGFAGMPQDIFFVHADDPRTLDVLRGGRAYYLPEFGRQHTQSNARPHR